MPRRMYKKNFVRQGDTQTIAIKRTSGSPAQSVYPSTSNFRANYSADGTRSAATEPMSRSLPIDTSGTSATISSDGPMCLHQTKPALLLPPTLAWVHRKWPRPIQIAKNKFWAATTMDPGLKIFSPISVILPTIPSCAISPGSFRLQHHFPAPGKTSRCLTQGPKCFDLPKSLSGF